ESPVARYRGPRRAPPDPPVRSVAAGQPRPPGRGSWQPARPSPSSTSCGDDPSRTYPRDDSSAYRFGGTAMLIMAGQHELLATTADTRRRSAYSLANLPFELGVHAGKFPFTSEPASVRRMARDALGA